MADVTDNCLKGNYGTAVVMERLSTGCLVRPVAGGTDVGVDLYCETIENKQPFLHFWVQVKAGAQCKVNHDAKTASCRFQRDHLEYWKRQPVPVFAALVPTDWPPQDPDVYIIDVTTYLIMNDLPRNQTSVELPSVHHWPAGSRKEVGTFLSGVVPDSTARLQCSKGYVTSSPTLGPQYERRVPVVPAIRYKKTILTQLRHTAAFSILFEWDRDRPAHEKDDSEFRCLLARIVEQFGDDEHWENFMARALSSHMDSKYDCALKLYQRAKSIIQLDRQVRDKPEWQERIEHIEACEKRARHREPPYPGANP
jgi:hypothetical protein